MGHSCKDCKYMDLSDTLGEYSCWCSLKRDYKSIHDWCSKFELDESGSGGCYLTSACVEYQGKADDCEELTTLRNFRDKYLKSTEEGRKLVEEYYAVAPAIVGKINAADKKDLYYRYISGVIEKCVSLIGLNDNQSALQEYKSMVLFLKKEFSL